MSAAQFVGRVGGMAVALGIGVAIAQGTAVAGADTDGADSSSRASSSADAHRGSATPKRGAAQATAAEPAASTASTRVNKTPVAPDLEVSIPDLPVALPAAAAITVPAAAAPAAPANPQKGPVFAPVGPDPKATIETEYGTLGKWMINRKGQVADWVGLPYCKDGTCKTLQEPINVIFTVKAKSKLDAERTLNFTMRKAGFPPSVFSSVGYKGIVGDQTSGQMPRGGILGLGVLGPGNIQGGLLGALAGVGPAYRDDAFWKANTHLRTFGGVQDKDGDWVFTASVSEEYLAKDPATGKTTHAYESFDQARTKLLDAMVKKAGATDQGKVEMFNAYPCCAEAEKYSTGDADGLAQVIAITGMTSLAWRPPNVG